MTGLVRYPVRDVVWDMETGDPDDFLTLLMLAGHPQVNLRAVTVTPACCAIDPGIATWAEVEIYQVGNEWGSRRVPGAGTSIITGYDHDRFLATLLAR